ncbi:MAG: hypothetical protein DRN78_02930 [Thermoproteota archaeon]|nr:MAG: hypothetical protein DRN78_02930 [Candidatus Korarchaeota archaeon]
MAFKEIVAMSHHTYRSFGPSLSSAMIVVLALFLVLQFLSSIGGLPQVRLPGFDMSPVMSIIFLGLFLLASAFMSLKTGAYFFLITWFAYFCEDNASLSPGLDALAKLFFAVRDWFASSQVGDFLSPLHISASDLGLFINLVIFLLIAMTFSKEKFNIKIVMPEQRHVHQPV